MPFLVTKKPAFSKFAVLELSKENKLNAPISRQIVSGFTIQIFLIHGITSLAIGRQYYILGNRSTFLNVNAGPRTKVYSIQEPIFYLYSIFFSGIFSQNQYGQTGEDATHKKVEWSTFPQSFGILISQTTGQKSSTAA